MSGDPSSLIIGSVVVIVGTTIVREIIEKKPVRSTVEPVVFGFLLAMVLLAVGLFAPGFARGLALLGLVGAFAVNGPALFGLLGVVK